MYNVMVVDDLKSFITRLSHLEVWKKYSDTFDLKFTLTDSRQALNILRKERVDVLITDIGMPGLSGLDLLRYAGEEELCRCTLLMSERTDFEYAHEAIILGAFDYLVKPVTDNMMLSSMERARKFISENDRRQQRTDDEDINSGINAVCNCIINGYESFAERVHGLAEVCRAKSGNNLTRFEISVGDAAEAVYIRLCEYFPWIENVVSSPERLKTSLLRAESREISEYLLTDFCRELFLAVKSYYPTRMNELTKSVADYILENYSRKLTLSDVADACFVNKTHLSHIFKVNMGISFIDYIVRYKMQMLKVMTAQSDMTVNEMAERLGYDDCKYMSRLFKSTYGVTITEYRKSIPNKQYIRYSCTNTNQDRNAKERCKPSGFGAPLVLDK